MWTWIKNFFKSIFTNEVIKTIAVQELALAVFKKHPETKAVVADAISRAISVIENGTVTSVVNLGAIIKSKLDFNKLPEDQKPILIPVLNQIIDQFCTEMNVQIMDSNIKAPSAQLVEYLKMLKGILEVAK